MARVALAWHGTSERSPRGVSSIQMDGSGSVQTCNNSDSVLLRPATVRRTQRAVSGLEKFEASRHSAAAASAPAPADFPSHPAGFGDPDGFGFGDSDFDVSDLGFRGGPDDDSDVEFEAVQMDMFEAMLGDGIDEEEAEMRMESMMEERRARRTLGGVPQPSVAAAQPAAPPSAATTAFGAGSDSDFKTVEAACARVLSDGRYLSLLVAEVRRRSRCVLRLPIRAS